MLAIINIYLFKINNLWVAMSADQLVVLMVVPSVQMAVM